MSGHSTNQKFWLVKCVFFLFNNIVITLLLVFFDVAYFMSVAVLLLVGFVDLVMALLWLHELSRK